MAKKEKIELTPEELEAKMTRKKEKRGIFGNTFVKSMAALLALLLVYSVAYIAFGKGPVATTGTGNAGSSSSSGDDSFDQDDSSNSGGTAGGGDTGTAGGETTTAATGGSSGGSSGGSTSGDPSKPAGESTAATIAKAINAATATASKAGYTWSRDRVIKESIDVGALTGMTNTLIKSFDKTEGAGIDKTVGWFLETSQTAGGGKPVTATAPKGGALKDRKDYESLKATNLSATDIKNASIKGDVYTFTLSNVTNPKRDGKSSFSRLTYDFVIEEDVSAALEKETKGVVKVAGSTVKYKDIKVTATIKDGKFTEYKISYYFNAAPLVVKAGFTINGTGGGQTDIVYNNFAY